MNFPARLSRNRPRTLLGLAIEDNGLAVALVRRAGGQCRAEDAFTLPLTGDRLLAEPEETGRLLAGALQERGLTEKRCAVRLPLAWAMAVPLELPDLSGPDLDGFLQLRAEREFPFAPERMALAHQRFDRFGGGGWATLAALDRARVEAVQRFLVAAGRQPVSIALGLGGCGALAAQEAEPALHVCPAGAGVDLLLVAEGQLVTFRRLGGLVGEPGAHANVDPATLVREIRVTLGRLPNALRDAFRTARFHGPDGLIDGLFRGCAERLRERGWERVERAPGRAIKMPAGPMPAACEPALEVACGRLSDRPAPFEFLPPVVSPWERFYERYGKGGRRQIITAGAALGLLLVLPALVQSHRLASLEARWKEIEPDVKGLEVVQENIRQFRRWFDNRPATLEIIRAVTSAFPEEGSVWARRLELKPGGSFACNGLARSSRDLMATLDRLRQDPRVTELKVKQVRGRDPVQFTFQFTWKDDARS